jgi:hypothetical protein
MELLLLAGSPEIEMIGCEAAACRQVTRATNYNLSMFVRGKQIMNAYHRHTRVACADATLTMQPGCLPVIQRRLLRRKERPARVRPDHRVPQAFADALGHMQSMAIEPRGR